MIKGLLWTLSAVIAVMTVATIVVADAPRPTMLETWVFLAYNGFITPSQIREKSDQTLVTPESPYVNRHGTEVWRIENAENCTIISETKELGIKRVQYLNNLLPHYQTTRDGSALKFHFRGEKPVQCLTNNGEEECMTELVITAKDNETAMRFTRALEYLFSSFCRYASYSTPY